MKYKICPHCGKHNPPTAFDCAGCYTDLTAVRLTDLTAARPADNKTDNVQPVAVRVCAGCAFENPANARKCIKCGEDISDVTPTAAPKTQTQPAFVLTSLDGEYAYKVQPGKTVIGREAAMSDYLKNKVYVSRRHAELELNGGILTVMNLSHTNFTFVNGERLSADAKELNCGDELALGGGCKNGQRQQDAAYFTVGTDSCT